MLNLLTPIAAPETTTAAEDGATRESLSPATWLTWLDESWNHPIVQTSLWALGILLAALVAHFIARYIILPIAAGAMRRSRITWDDALVQRNVLHRLVPIAPLLVIHRGLAVLPIDDELASYIQRLVLATIALVIARGLGALLSAVNDIYSRYPIARGRPIKGYLQVVKVLIYIAVGIVITAAIINREPWFFLSGLGAMMAVIMLIFRDTILSLVAGIQLSGNDLIRMGDWIEMPAFGADGDVVDISLNVVKVQNWDRTITCIPTHKFLDHSFKNWRSMSEGGGRRIKRPLYIDMSTIRFLTEAEIKTFCDFLVLRDYMKAKIDEIETYNARLEDKAKIVANARHLTNIGTFRAYVIHYLKNHPKVHQNMTQLVRQLNPTPHGLPLEIYVFTNDTNWANYESIQSDIFDHLFAVAPEFGLRIYQQPAGSDLARLDFSTSSERSHVSQTVDGRSNGKS